MREGREGRWDIDPLYTFFLPWFYSGVGTTFVLGGPRCIGRGGPKQHYIIMRNKISKARIHT